MARRADISLYGATGFTGALVAERLANDAPADAKLLLAGRNREKLQAVAARFPGRFELLNADSSDAASLAKLAESSRVVVSTVGPYAKYGLPLVEACARAGTHYGDITGETQFIRYSIDRADSVAKQSGARIVHTCGFDSIPSDLGVWLLHDTLKQRGQSGHLRDVTLVVESMRGGVSGGTFASMVNLMEEARSDKALRRLVMDPYALSPDREREPNLGDERDPMGVAYEPRLGLWTGPFVMAAINTRVVRRSNALLGYPYGRELRYREVMATGSGAAGMARAAAVVAGLGSAVATLQLAPKPLARALTRLLPQSGEGPSEAQRTRGSFRIRLLGTTEEGTPVQGVVSAQGDPGYSETSKMLAQSALCLAYDEAKLEKRAGVLTPASAMGRVLVERLRRAGMVFDVA